MLKREWNWNEFREKIQRKKENNIEEKTTDRILKYDYIEEFEVKITQIQILEHHGASCIVGHAFLERRSPFVS